MRKEIMENVEKIKEILQSGATMTELEKAFSSRKKACEALGWLYKEGKVFSNKSGKKIVFSSVQTGEPIERYKRENIEKIVGKLWHALDHNPETEKSLLAILDTENINLWIATGWLIQEDLIDTEKKREGVFLKLKK